MKRWAIGLAVFFALAGGAIYWLYTSLDLVVKTAIEHFAPDVLGVAVSVREVQLSTTSGLGTLRGVEIGNPAGYSAPRAFRAGTITVRVEPASIRRDVVVIRDILVESPEISYERKGGTNNLEAINKNIEAYLAQAAGNAPGTAGNETSAKVSGRRYVIGRITLRGARVTMTNEYLQGGGLTFDIPDVDLRGLGEGTGGVTAAQAAAQVTSAILVRIAQSVLTNVEALRKGGVEGALDALRGLIR